MGGASSQRDAFGPDVPRRGPLPGHSRTWRGRRWRRLGPPPLHFLLIGVVLFGANRWLAAPGEPGGAETIEITAGQIDGLRLEWMRRHKAVPTPEQIGALVEETVQDEILFREALRVGLDRSSPVVRRRLLQIGAFLDLEESAAEEELLREVRTLGLDRDDPVIRRHLVAMMRRLYGRAEVPRSPSEAEVRAYVQDNPSRFMLPERVALAHVYLSADRRGADLLADALAVLERLESGAVSVERASELGDRFLRGHDFALQTQRQVASVFGPAFSKSAMRARQGAWSGPIESPYGLHLVWVKSNAPARMPDFEQIRARAHQELLSLRAEERLQERIQALASSYRVRLETVEGGVADAT